ncbi:MAG: hypothetical protein AB1Z67_00725 [Candidatus Limnocylindrales bacterium]
MRLPSLALTVAVAVLVVAGVQVAWAQSGIEPAPSSACDRDGLVADVIPDHVRGTTFVGTYEGDALGGVGDAHALTTLWSVERVYAGGTLPQHLAFETPACGWVNLTPGTRYLFSTAVTGLGGKGLAAATPSVTDSLAWELLPDGGVRLAPFDTYLSRDYHSEELQVIESFTDALWSVAPEAGEGSAPAPGATETPGCTDIDFMAAPEQTRGTSFIGRYDGDEALPGPGHGDVRTFWTVERVFAGGPLPELLTMRSSGCDPVVLEPDRRYLFSTADALAPAWGNSLAWSLADDGRAHLAPFVGTGEDWYASAATEPEDLGEVLALVAPDAGDGVAPLRAASLTPG